MMDKYKYKVKITGHTPVIHFEKNISAPALRPTELKSKLDKFLLRKGYKNLSVKTPDGKKEYFDYKIKINNINIDHSKSRPINKNDKLPFFFGNMGDDYTNGDKRLVFVKEAEIEFFSFNTEIIKAIKDNFKLFLSITNFGTRQNKGYGSFSLDKVVVYPNTYKIVINKSNYNEVMKDMEIFYKFIRSGINLSQRRSSPFYIKPAIWKYFIEKNIVWEKKAIKRRCFQNKLNEQAIEHNNDEILTSEGEERIVRDVLGLSTSQDWRSYRVKVEKENPHIKRFKSPLFFKYIKNPNAYTVYVSEEKRAEEKLNTFLNKPFRIEAGRCSFDLNVVEEFDVNDFLNWLYKNKNTIVDELSNGVISNEYRILKRILNDMKKVGK